MKVKEKENLTLVLMWQQIAGARNVKPMDRLEALYKDVGLVVVGKDPEYAKELVRPTSTQAGMRNLRTKALQNGV